jgi:hypothetical protein
LIFVALAWMVGVGEAERSCILIDTALHEAKKLNRSDGQVRLIWSWDNGTRLVRAMAKEGRSFFCRKCPCGQYLGCIHCGGVGYAEVER